MQMYYKKVPEFQDINKKFFKRYYGGESLDELINYNWEGVETG